LILHIPMIKPMVPPQIIPFTGSPPLIIAPADAKKNVQKISLSKFFIFVFIADSI